MTCTITAPGAFDALEKALPGETMFALLARDPCAPATITEWTRLRRNRALVLYGESSSATDKELLAAELRQCAEAEEVAMTMAEWRNAEVPAEGARSPYQEIIKTADELVEADRRKRLEQAVRDLREAAYHLSEASEALSGLGLLPAATGHDLLMMLARINGLADEHQARRVVAA